MTTKKKPAAEPTPAPSPLCQHAARLEAAREAIDRLHTDTSVSKDVTRASLQEIAEHCETLIESLDECDEGKGD